MFWKRQRISTNFLSTWEKEYFISLLSKLTFSSWVCLVMINFFLISSSIKFSLSRQLRFLDFHFSLIKRTVSPDNATHGMLSIFTNPSNFADDFIPCSILLKVSLLCIVLFSLIHKQRLLRSFDRNPWISAYHEIFLSNEAEADINLEQLWEEVINFLSSVFQPNLWTDSRKL